MGINEKLQECLVSAQKSGDKIRLSTIRLLKSAVRYEEDAKRHKLDENEFIALVAKLIKQRHESIELFKQGKRDDLVQKEEAEIKVLEEFLPPQLSRDELLKIVDEAIKEVQANTVKDLGRVMKVLMPKVRGRVDAEVVKNLVVERLSGTSQSG
jgi:uncharacterized protein YqeY